jgi:putative Holliday junction resolvase
LVYQDERLTTVQAQKVLIQADVSRKKRKEVIDKQAAVLILQGYLDRLYYKKAQEADQEIEE